MRSSRLSYLFKEGAHVAVKTMALVTINVFPLCRYFHPAAGVWTLVVDGMG